MTHNNNKTLVIKVKRVSQYGDNFLMHFDCPSCGEENFSEGLVECCGCGLSFHDCLANVDDAKSRLVVGTMRKFRFSKKLIRKMYDEQEGKCVYCFIPLSENYHLEHIRPLCVGGTNRSDNICLSFPSCNLIAGSLVFSDFFAKQRYILMQKEKRLNK